MDHITLVNINVAETPTTDAIMNAHVNESNGRIKVRYSLLSGGAPDKKWIL